MKPVTAFCPAGISSFFQAVTPEAPPTTMEEACRVGARGGGFVLEKGTFTTIVVDPADSTSIEVFINNVKSPEAKVTKEVCGLLLDQVETSYAVSVTHEVEVPIGAGYGASASGAICTALALSKAVGLKLTLNQLAQFAHTAEIRCATGLGSVSGIVRGGAVLILEPGAPGYDRVDWLPIEPSYRIITASLAPIPKEDIIFSKDALQVVNREAKTVMKQVLRRPDLGSFLLLCYEFAKKAGFLTKRTRSIIDALIEAGSIGATQNMIGDAFHALVEVDQVENIVTLLQQEFSLKDILVSRISLDGPRYT